MLDIILESFRAIITFLIILALLRQKQRCEICSIPGWKNIVTGFILLLFGNLLDITDDFTSLNSFVVIGDTQVQSFLEKVVGYLGGMLFLFIGIWKWLPKMIEKQTMITDKLDQVEEEVKALQGLLPICATCKKVRDDQGYWNQIEAFIANHADVSFSHSICPDCLKKHYPQEYENIQKATQKK